MRYYEMVEPSHDLVGYDIPVWSYLSQDEIINSTYGSYVCLMWLTRLNKLPTREQVVEEWCICHWGGEVK